MTQEVEARFERIETNIERIGITIEKLAGVVNTLAATVVGRNDQIEAHDRQIAALIELSAQHDKRLADLTLQWQAYVNILPEQ